MRIPAKRILWVIVALAVSSGVIPALGSSSYKCKQPACDINAIGHRKLFAQGVGNWYSPQTEKKLGDQYAAEFEKKVEIVKDEAVTSYVDRVAQHIAQNSDADMPVTVRIIQRNDAGAFTLPGHLYLTTGLLLRLHNEGELASVLARGIAHTAIHSLGRMLTREAMLKMTSAPALGIDILPPAPGSNDFAAMLTSLKFRRGFELEADYFGIQYVYKSGYDTNCFLSALQTVWQPDPRKPQTKAFSLFPPLEDRMKMLRQEADDILPKRPGDVVTTPEFDSFMEHLRQITPPSEKDVQPRLIRHDPASNR
jgi:predicted Zn-dependent protease